MKITKGQIDDNGNHTCTVELDSGELLKGFHLNHHYQIYPDGPVVNGGTLMLHVKKVVWNTFDQCWVNDE